MTRIKNRTRGTGALVAASVLAGGLATVPVVNANAEEMLEEVVVLGTRRDARSVSDSPVPVDVISGQDFQNQGSTDMDSMLRAMIPSYNVNSQPISDAATLVRPANLRGLSPDSTLVLVNGKRRHRASVISFLGGGVADGAQGPDLSAIPGIALKQVEVLRDGASAQYGSDAIAGVINFVLKDAPDGGSVEARVGETYEGDGQVKQLAMNVGLPLGSDGFANFSAEFRDTEDTSRSVQRDDAAALIAAGNTAVANPAQIWGTPEVTDDYKLFMNTGLNLGNGREAYMFGSWAERTVKGGFFFRNPNTRGGINDGPVVADPLNPGQTVDTILVGDFTPNDGLGCPLVAIRNNVPDQAALTAIDADPNCFAWNNQLPGGFTPNFGGDIADTSLVLGSRGELGWNEIFYDISAGVGRHSVDYFIVNTINPQLASLGDDTPREFKPGSYVQLERTFNLDLSKEVAVDAFSSPLNVAGGIEIRDEEFQIKNGDANSFAIDPVLAPQGFGIGSNGFAGFKPEDAGTNARNSWAAYLDFEADVTEDLLLAASVRYEDFEDFGNNTSGKLAGRWQVTPDLALRASVSNGFRAPTPGQANVRNVTTAFTNGMLADEATLPPTNPISQILGGKALEPEESVNFAFGALFDVGDLSVTVDYFNVEVTDRIALTTTFPLTPQNITDLLAQGVTDASSFTGVRFFTNDFDTTTQGVDMVATYPIRLGEGSTDLSFVFNWTETTVDKFNPTIIGDTRVRQLEDNLPEYRWSLSASHIQGPFRGLVRVNFFGEYYEAHLDDGTLPIDADSEFTVDTELAWSFTEDLTVVLGAQNLFDEEPDKNPWAGIAGAEFPVTSPMGFNGGFWYLRAVWDFNQ